MSNIMRKLKKLEKRVAGSPLTGGQVGNESAIHTRDGNTGAHLMSWNSSRTALLLVLGIGLGVLGYFAGIRSNRGEGGQTVRPTGEDSVATESVVSVSKPVVNKETPEENEGDLSTLVFDDEPIFPSKLPIAMGIPQAGPRSETPVLDQDRSAPGIDSTDPGVYDEGRITALTAAIIRATDEPITQQEDDTNKDDIRRLKILGIVEEADGMVAVISGTSVKEGDEFRQFTVEEISNNYIVLAYKGKLYRKFAR